MGAPYILWLFNHGWTVASFHFQFSPVGPQTVKVKIATDAFSECRKKNIPTKKICDMFLLFFGVIGGSANAIGRILS